MPPRTARPADASVLARLSPSKLATFRGLGRRHPGRLGRLVYLEGDGQVLALPFSAQLAGATERQVRALAIAMDRALTEGRWHASVGRGCDWCAFKASCPAGLEEAASEGQLASG